MKLKQWIKKLINKLIEFIKWIWKECANFKTLLLLGVVCLVIGIPVWGGGLLWLIFDWKWALAMAVGCLAFWWLPGTPFFVLSISITLAIKRWGRQVFNKGVEVHNKNKRKFKAKKAKFKKYMHSHHFHLKKHKHKEKDNNEDNSTEK